MARSLTKNGWIGDEKGLDQCCSLMISKTMKDWLCFNFGMEKIN